MYFTTISEDKLLRMFNGKTVQALGPLFAGLYLSSPGETGTGTEIAYEDYERMLMELTPPAAANGVAGGVSISNTADVTFAKSSTAAGTVTYLGLHDSKVPGTGNMLAYMKLDENIQVNANVAPSIVAQEWTYIFSGDFSLAYKEKIINWLRGNDITGFTPYFAAFNGNPDQGGSELAGGNYKRFPATFTTPSVNGTGQSMITIATDTGSVRPDSNWGTWTHTAIMTAETGGEVVCFKQEPAANVLSVNRRIIVNAGAFSILMN